MTKEQIIQTVREAGVVGAGGAGFPTHVKLSRDVEMVIANGSECEPLLESDKTLLRTNPEAVVKGLKLAMAATGAKEGVIAIKGHYREVIAAVSNILPKDGSIRIHELDNYYPAGDEVLTVYDVTGKVVPEGGLPLDVGVVVANVLTLSQIFYATAGKPVTHRLITVTGSVGKPIVVNVPVGTSYRDLLEMAEGATVEDFAVLDGGPMMGRIIDDLDSGIAKTSSGMIVLPKDHLVVRMQQKTLPQMIRQSKSACCQCFRCSDLCSRNLIGHELYPHLAMRTVDYNLSQPSDSVTSAFLCSQCGLCELVACDFMMLSPRKIYAGYKAELLKKGVKNPHSRRPARPRETYEGRKISIPTLLMKLGMTRYAERKAEDLGLKSADRVRIHLNRHIGALAQSVVRVGQQVGFTDLIAKNPDNQLGSRYHASIEGTVTDLTDTMIEITGADYKKGRGL